MATYTTDSSTSLEEQRIEQALALIADWKRHCYCGGGEHFCESFGCSSLDEIATILRGDTRRDWE